MKETKSSSFNNEDSRDPITNLGGVGCVLVCLLLIKLIAYIFGFDAQDNDPNNQSYFRIHEAFQPAFSKMLG